MCAFPKGNQYYLLRSKDGRDKQYPTPASFLKAANEYFKWVIDNPLYETQAFHSKGIVVTQEIPRMRPFTLQGLCNFMDISVQCFHNYEKRDDYVELTTRIRQVIENHQFEGASAGFLNPNIIARKLGLSDKIDHTHREQPLFPDEKKTNKKSK